MKLEKKSIILTIISIIIFTIIGIILWNVFKTEEPKLSKETQQLKGFTASILESVGKYNPTEYSSDTMKKELIETVTLAQVNYKSDSVGISTLNIMDEINGLTGTSEEILNEIKTYIENYDIEGFVNKIESSSKPTNVLTLRSNTVCDTEAIDYKYCLDGNNSKLSANVYVHDEESTKWVVLLHPFMTNGSVMYGVLGETYKELGYNVLAPDSRGFGNSSGKVAMGYLESLDTYDWLLDLHYNYEKRYGVKNQPDTIIIHGISLGATTTLQLATNPDIAALEDNLTKLGVKAFYDDGGYTSMDGLIKDILVNQDMGSLAVILSSLGVDFEEFMKELQNILNSLGVTGLENFDMNNISDMEEFFKDVTEFINYIQTADIKGVSDLPENIKEKLKKYLSEDIYNSIFNTTNAVTQNNKAITNTYGAFNFGSFLNNSIGTTVTNTVGTGLNSMNFSRYSNVFSMGRTFPTGSKVVVVKNENDTTIPPSNAETTVNNAKNNLYYKHTTEKPSSTPTLVESENDNETNNTKDDTAAIVSGLDECATQGKCEEPNVKEENTPSTPNTNTSTNTNNNTNTDNKKQPPNGVIKSEKEEKYGYTYLKGLEPTNTVDENYEGSCEMQVKETTTTTPRKVYYYKWNYNTGKYEKVSTETNGVKYMNKSKVDGRMYMQWYLTIDGKKYYTSIYKRKCTTKNSEFEIYDHQSGNDYNQKYINNVDSKYKVNEKTTVNVEKSILITTANYQATLKEYNNNSTLKKNIKNDIKNKYLFTAPHAVIHWRENDYKVADVKTGVICETLAKLTNSVCISRTAFDETDPNVDNYKDSKFQKLAVELINAKSIRYHVDIHGLANGRGFEYAIGTRKGATLYSSDQCVVEKNLTKAINKYASGAAISLNGYSSNKCKFKESGLSDIKLTSSYTGGELIVNTKANTNISKFSSVQIEISNDYRTKPKLMAKTINSIYSFLEE